MGFIVLLVFVLIAAGVIAFIFSIGNQKENEKENPKETKRKLLDELWSSGKLNDEVYKDYLKKL